MAIRTPKLNPAPLPNGGQGGFLNMAKGDGTLAKKHSAEADLLEAEYAAKKAQLDHKHEQERKAAAKPAPTVAQPRKPKGK